VTLKPDELTSALKLADREAGVCTKFCRYGIEVNLTSPTWSVYHNGLGPSDSNEQIIHNALVMAFGEEALRDRFALWLAATHKRTAYDLNGVA
jgi:hypothetical protein